MAKPKKDKPTEGAGAARTGGGAGSRQGDMTEAARAGEAGSLQPESGGMAGAGSASRQSALPEAELPIQTGGERIGVGHHRQGRQTGALHQPTIADELAAESQPDRGTAAREGKRKG